MKVTRLCGPRRIQLGTQPLKRAIRPSFRTVLERQSIADEYWRVLSFITRDLMTSTGDVTIETISERTQAGQFVKSINQSVFKTYSLPRQHPQPSSKQYATRDPL